MVRLAHKIIADYAEARRRMFMPKLEILSPAQRRVWSELNGTPPGFVLYGGTALALRLGHRHSEDFDFFSNQEFVPDVLRREIRYLQGAEVSQLDANTLTAIVERDGPIKISFFGGLKLNRIQNPDVAKDNGVQVASLLDVAATKLATIQQRAQARDYEDIAAITNAGISLVEALGAAAAVYGKEFNGALSLKALTYFDDGDLPSLSTKMKNKLRDLAGGVGLNNIPMIASKPGLQPDMGAAK
jgi:predicted nucleotidyltransferase component of viral defense system